MKKFIFILFAIFMVSVASYGQGHGCYQGVKSETIYEIGHGNELRGEVCVINGEFYLFGVTDAPFITTNASIYLGNSADKAIETLKSLQSLGKRSSKVKNKVYQGFGERKTNVWQCGFDLEDCLVFKTEGIAGESYLLTLDFNYDDAIMAVGEYISDLPSNK